VVRVVSVMVIKLVDLELPVRPILVAREEVRVHLDFLDLNYADEGRGDNPEPRSSRREEAQIETGNRKPETGNRSDQLGAHPTSAGLPHNYVTEPHHRIEIYRKLAQATDKAGLEALLKELRDRFGPLPPAAELLLAIAELKILASDKNVTTIEVEDDKLKLIRAGDFITLGGKFPRLTKKDPKARLKEIRRLLLAI